MIASAQPLTEVFLSCAALLGLGMLRFTLVRRDRWDPLNRRFLFGITVIMLVFGGRALVVMTGGEWFRFVVLIAAALIPLAALILTEGLLRRHAQSWAKMFVALGTVGFVLLAFLPSYLVDPFRIIGLLVFQVSALTIAGWLVLTRDQNTLSVSENTMIARLGLSLIVLIPLVAADFLVLYLDLPVQPSALGVLFLCWLTVGLGRAQTSNRGPLMTLAVMMCATLLTGLLISLIGDFERAGTIMVLATIMAAMFVVAIFNDLHSLQNEEQSLSLLQHMASAPNDPLVFLRGLQSHPLVEGAVVVRADSLTDMDEPTLGEIFAAAPVLRKADPPHLGPTADDHIAHLFKRFAATHIIHAMAEPRVLVALSMPSLSTSPYAELELRAVQRMAALMANSERETNDST